MNPDVVIQLAEAGMAFFRRRVVKLIEPAELAAAHSGQLTPPPAGLWSAESEYAKGDADALQLSVWLRGCFGKSILAALRKAYPKDGLQRVLVSAEPSLEAQMMTTPWEVLELPAADWATAERLSTVRVLGASENVQTPKSSADPLKVAVLWADPDQNIPEKKIPDLPDHLRLLKEFLDRRPVEFTATGPVEFTDHDSVREVLASVRPDIVYYIGHADPLSTDTVALRIGRAGQRSYENVGDFLTLLQEVGPPRLLFLNACSAALGWKMNPYLGVALSCGRAIDAVLAMQTEVPVDAAMVFAREFFSRLAAGAGLAAASKSGRNEIHRIYQPPSFTPFIPVLTQRTRLDNILAVDPDGRALRYLLRELESEIERVDPLLNRRFDAKLQELMRGDAGRHRVTIVHGPKGSGKSTSVRRVVREQLTEVQFRAGERYLYYDAGSAAPDGSDLHLRSWRLLSSFARRLRPLTEGLTSALQVKDPAGPQNRPGAVPVLAAWLDEEERAGHHYHIVLDHLDAELAAHVAEAAGRVLGAGHLTLVAQEAPLDPAWPLDRLEVGRMSGEEVEAVLEGSGLRHAPEDIERLMSFSNGLPYFVAGYVRRGSAPAGTSGDLAQAFLENRSPALSPQELDVLQLAALCREPLPGEVLERTYPRSVVSALAGEDYLLMKTGEDSYRLPEVLREHLAGRAAGRPDLHEIAFNGFLDAAEAGEPTLGEAKYRMVTRWLAEALRHALALAELQGDLGRLDSARDIAETLHDRYLSQGEAAAARLAWESYRAVAQTLGRYDDRISDVRYADCLMRAGEYEEAELLLEQATIGDDTDPTQLAALFLWSNLEKDRGRRGAREQRIARLQAALGVAARLEQAGADRRWVRRQVASLKHTLGNALGFGREAQPDEALRLLDEAREIFEELNDVLDEYRTVNEQIEIKRYNKRLSPQECDQSKGTLRENLRGLVARDMRFDAVQHLYELGRLETDPARRAGWFQQAFERAGKIYEPENWHAGINWRRAQVEAGLATFPQVAPFLEEYAARLAPWHGRAWCRRKRREALLFLGRGYREAGDTTKALAAASECWRVVAEIAQAGEGRKDREERLHAAALAIALARAQGDLDEARAVAASQEQMDGKDPGPVSRMDAAELEQYANHIEEGI